MKTSYIKEDKRRSYCGIIHIFNFLADSFKYNRTSDIGYMIGRIFVNRETHYFVEGKREIGLLYNNFSSSELDTRAIITILQSSILYTLNFDLLTPPYDNMKEVTVQEMQTTLDNLQFRTGKRLGFRFQSDSGE
jgi:carbamate kinase